MPQHTFRTHMPHLSYVTKTGEFVNIPGTLILDSSTQPELVKELSAISKDPGSPIYEDDVTELGVAQDHVMTQQALTVEMRSKAAAAALADKAAGK